VSCRLVGRRGQTGVPMRPPTGVGHTGCLCGFGLPDSGAGELRAAPGRWTPGGWRGCLHVPALHGGVYVVFVGRRRSSEVAERQLLPPVGMSSVFCGAEVVRRAVPRAPR